MIIPKYSDTERRQYEESKKVFWDNYSVIKTARDKGVREGLQQGIQQGLQQGLQQGIQQGLQQGIQQGLQQGVQQVKIETIHRMGTKGFSVEDISEIVGLTVDEVKKLLY